jgi:protein ImuA
MVATALERILSDGVIRRGSGYSGRVLCDPPAILPTGIPAIDQRLPRGGLKPGATHEWFGLPLGAQDGPAARGGPWAPPLGIVSVLAQSPNLPRGPILWIGRRVWPMPLALGAGMERSLFIDPDCDAARFWAVDQALRCPEVAVVVADGMRLDMAASRRLQLAAECGGITAFLLRPSWERGVISAAETRWMVRPAPPREAAERSPRWEVELLRCKGASLGSQGLRWTVEVTDACALRVPADVVDRPGQAETAAGLRIA